MSRFVLCGIIAISLVGCHQAHNVAVTGVARPKIDEDAVRYYVSPPAHYLVVGVIAAEAHQFTPHGRKSNLLQELREAAAEVGANGVLLDPAQVSLPSGQLIDKPLSADAVELFLNTDENLHATAIYVEN